MAPNIKSKNAYKMGKEWGNFTPKGHIYYFDNLTVYRMLKKAGYTKINIFWGGETGPLKIMEKINWNLNMVKGKILYQCLSRLMNCYRRFQGVESMTIYARKPACEETNG